MSDVLFVSIVLRISFAYKVSSVIPEHQFSLSLSFSLSIIEPNPSSDFKMPLN